MNKNTTCTRLYRTAIGWFIACLLAACAVPGAQESGPDKTSGANSSASTGARYAGPMVTYAGRRFTFSYPSSYT